MKKIVKWLLIVLFVGSLLVTIVSLLGDRYGKSAYNQGYTKGATDLLFTIKQSIDDKGFAKIVDGNNNVLLEVVAKSQEIAPETQNVVEPTQEKPTEVPQKNSNPFNQ